MEGTALIYRPEEAPETIKLTAQPGLKFLQEAVGGYIERVPLLETIMIDDKEVVCRAYCHEEGKLNHEPVNRVATTLWHLALMRLRNADGTRTHPAGLMKTDGGPLDLLVGTIIVLFGDDEFMELI